MALLEIILTIGAAILIGFLFYYIFRSTGPWGTFWSFVLILILAGLVAEAWITPIGPVLWDFSWVTTLFVIFIFALLLAAASPPRTRSYTEAEAREPVTKEELEESRESAVALSIFFWILLIALLVVIIWSFL